MDDHRSPRVPTQVWVTLGLFLLSSVITAGMFLAVVLTADNEPSKVIREAYYHWAATFPQVLFMIAAWRGRQRTGLSTLCLVAMGLYVLQATAIVVTIVSDGVVKPTICIVPCLFVTGWPIGIAAVAVSGNKHGVAIEAKDG